MALALAQQAIESVNRANHILLATRGLPANLKAPAALDGLTSSLGLALFLDRLGKQVDVVANGYQIQPHLNFLPRSDQIKSSLDGSQKFVIKLDLDKTKLREMSYEVIDNELQIFVTPEQGSFTAENLKTHAEDFKYDLIITLDVPDLEQLGAVFEQNTKLFFNTPIINIDHQADNEHFGAVNLVDLTASATSEVVYNHLEDWNRSLIDERVALCLLTGLLAKTQIFQTIKSPKTFQTAGRLVALGADQEKIMQALYRNRSLGTFKLWGRTLAHLKHDPTLKFAWSSLTTRDFLETGGEEGELLDVVQELILNSHEAETVLLLYEKARTSDVHQTEICGLLFSTKIKDVATLLAPKFLESTRSSEPQVGLARFCLFNQDILTAERAVVDELKPRLYNLMKGG